MCDINETKGTILFVDRSAVESKTNELTDSLHFVRVLLAVIYAILFALGLSNVLITFFIIRRRVFTTVTNILILNLSLADTIFIMFLPFVISFRIKRTWIFGTAMCKLFFISESTTKYASVYFVSLLSIDRYLSVRFQNYRVSRCKRMLAVVAALAGWTVISSLMVPIYMYSEVKEVTPHTVVCTIVWPADSFHDQFGQTRTTYTTEHYFTLYSFVLCFLIPSLIMTFCYYLLVKQVFMSGRRLRKHRTKCIRNSYGRLKRMVVSIVCCYLLCWTPYWIMNLIIIFNSNVQMTTSLRIMFNVIHILPYVSCVTNPLLYALFTSHFKEVVMKAARRSSLVHLTHFKNVGRFHIRMATELSPETCVHDSQTVTATQQNVVGSEIIARPSMRLILRPDPTRRHVSWATGTVDNEHLNRKKSKCCCVYVKPKKFDESSSEDEEELDCAHCSGHVEKRAQRKAHDTEKQPSGQPCQH
ncbi:hypothetical protein M513_01780 [Trichuris suis]|uniref:G-protein coupled receptors family 1 profile domain-containing protein n=1 Tax=Trichuris suis TaxID=68888 RepID=A0A085MJ73_9BILA|nr:hypothetical protein M513_01780 [Trichuris suis]